MRRFAVVRYVRAALAVFAAASFGHRRRQGGEPAKADGSCRWRGRRRASRDGGLRRSAASLVVLGAVIAGVFSGAAAGQPGQYTIRAGGDLDWVPTSGSFGPSSSSDPTSTSGTLTGPGGAAAYTVAAGPGIARGSMAGSYTLTTSNRFDPSVQADASSELTLVGPTGYVAIPVSLNLHVDSTFAVQQCADSCNISIGVVGHGGISRFSVGAGFTQNDLGLTVDPVAGGYHLHGDVSTPLAPTPNLPTSINLGLQINVTNLNHGNAGTSVFTVGPSTVSFATSGPVLSGVPPGYTVSGPGVVDNHWTDPFVPDIELRFADETPMQSNTELDLGEVASGSVVEGGYRIANTGSARLKVTDVAAELLNAGTAEAPVPASPSIDPGSSTPAVVRCGGTNTGANSRSVMFDVRISSNDPDESPSFFRVRCTVLPEPPGNPHIELQFADGTPMPGNAELDLGEVASGSVAEGSYRIANTGDGRLQITDVQVSRYSAFGVNEAPPPTNPSIDPGSYTTAVVRCGGTNLDPDARSVFFDVTVSGGGQASHAEAVFRVRCTVLPTPQTAPDIELRFADGTPMPATSPIVDLGDVPSGSVKPGTYRIANVGDATLEVSDIAHSTPAFGTAVAPTLSTSISPGGGTAAPLGCGGGNPDTTPRDVEFTVTVHSNDPDEASAQFTVRCRVLPASITPPPANPPDIELRFADGTPMPNPATLDLGDIASGATTTGDFQVGNTGDATLVVSDYSASPSKGEIHVAGIDTTTVLAGATTTGHVSCQGLNTGATPMVRTAVLTVSSNDPDESSVSVTVRCSILPEPKPDIELRYVDGTPIVNPVWLGNVASGEQVSRDFLVANVGGTTLHVTSINSPDCPLVCGHGSTSTDAILPGSTGQATATCGAGDNDSRAPVLLEGSIVIESDDPDENPIGLYAICQMLPETTPPTILGGATPGKNANGWNNTDVTVSWECIDYGSGVDPAASSLEDDVLTASGTATATCVDRNGNSASRSVNVLIDKAGPVVTYAGNAGTYGLLSTVAITCSAADPLSGVASTNCANASGPAWTFGAGSHTLTSTGTDLAGNTSSVSTTFTVNVSPAALTNLTKQFVQSSAKYQALRPAQRAAVDALVTTACNFLLNIGPTTAPALKAQFINAYKQAVQALVAPGWLTANQAATLKTLANAV